MKYININNMKLVAFNLDSFILSEFRSVVLEYTHYKRVNSPGNWVYPYVLHVFDCNGMSIGSIQFYLTIDPASVEDINEFDDRVSLLRDRVVEFCTMYSDEFADSLSVPNMFYMYITRNS